MLEKDYHRFQIYKIGPETDSQPEKIMIESEGFFLRFIYFSLNHPLEEADSILYFPTENPIVVRRRQAGDTILINGVNKNSAVGLLIIKSHRKFDKMRLLSSRMEKFMELRILLAVI